MEPHLLRWRALAAFADKLDSSELASRFASDFTAKIVFACTERSQSSWFHTIRQAAEKERAGSEAGSKIGDSKITPEEKAAIKEAEKAEKAALAAEKAAAAAEAKQAAEEEKAARAAAAAEAKAQAAAEKEAAAAAKAQQG